MPRDGVKAGRFSGEGGRANRGRWIVIGFAALVTLALLLGAATAMVRGIASSSKLVMLEFDDGGDHPDDPDYNPNDTALPEIRCSVKPAPRPHGSS